MLSRIKSEVWDFEPIDYLTNGKNCVYTARRLKNAPDKPAANYPMRILLVHGVELLLKAFIEHFDKSKFQRIHNLKELLETVEEIGALQTPRVIQINEIRTTIEKLECDYYPDSIAARYTNKNSRLEDSTFTVLEHCLIKPLEKVIYL